jgi:hypothetical protein
MRVREILIHSYGPFTNWIISELIFYQDVYTGHSASAYLLGKDLATWPRILVSSLQFTTFYMILATTVIPFHILFSLNVVYFFCERIFIFVECCHAECTSRYLWACVACGIACQAPGCTIIGYAWKPDMRDSGRCWPTSNPCQIMGYGMAVVYVPWCKLFCEIIRPIIFLVVADIERVDLVHRGLFQ